MPSQLLQRLNRFFDQDPAALVMAHENDSMDDHLGPAPVQDPAKPNKPGTNTSPHWKAHSDFGRLMDAPLPIDAPQSIMIHETSGWPSSESASHFVQRYLCLEYNIIWIPPQAGPPPVPGHWDDQIGRAVGPQFYVDGNGTTFLLVGQPNLTENPRVTIHGEGMSYLAVGIENGDVGDANNLRPADDAQGPRWWRLGTHPQDLPGLRVFALTHPDDAPDLNLIWFTTQGRGQAVPNFVGSGDTDAITTRYEHWNNMLFTERNYRSLSLLCRFIAENWGIPRNFLLLPYKRLEADAGDRATFRRLLLADQRRDTLVGKFAFTLADVQNNTNNFQTHYSRATWRSFFGIINRNDANLPCYRGFLSHDMNGHHPCPGPFFDWHRFAREVWDWWWYPFDIAAPPATVPPRRPYVRARGDTPLLNYYYDIEAGVADYAAIAVVAEDDARGPSNFSLTDRTPVYAMANGVLVAARMPTQSDPNRPGFTLIRHEVFWRTNHDSINYDHQPEFVWTLTSFTSTANANFTQPSDDNPDWLNRLIMRLVECEAAVTFHTANPNNASFNSGWDRVPTGPGPRVATGQLIQRDATEYRRLVTELQAGNAVLFPLEASASPTPVRVILGDFLGLSGSLHNGTPGVQVQIFSRDLLSVANTTRGALIWSSDDWWEQVTAALRHDGVEEADLPADGVVQQYQVVEFLLWINDITWASEWPKYLLAGDRPGEPVSRVGI